MSLFPLPCLGMYFYVQAAIHTPPSNNAMGVEAKHAILAGPVDILSHVQGFLAALVVPTNERIQNPVKRGEGAKKTSVDAGARRRSSPGLSGTQKAGGESGIPVHDQAQPSERGRLRGSR